MALSFTELTRVGKREELGAPDNTVLVSHEHEFIQPVEQGQCARHCAKYRDAVDSRTHRFPNCHDSFSGVHSWGLALRCHCALDTGQVSPKVRLSPWGFLALSRKEFKGKQR